MIVKEVNARKIKTSNNKDTIQVAINKTYVASAPLGTSTGKHEVRPFPREGIDFCVKYINNLKELIGMEFNKFEDLEFVEKYFKVVGGNSVLALQYALLKAMSDNEVFRFLNPNADKMPMPLGNVIGGGAHFKGNAPDFQEFLLMPNAKSFSENAFANEYAHRQIGRMYPKAKKDLEGAYALDFNNIRTLELLKRVLKKSEKELGFDIGIGIDVAATSFFRNGKYNYKNYSYLDSRKKLSRKEQIEFVNKLIADNNITYVEDPLHENDFDGFSKIRAKMVCGDDLICTNLERLEKAVGKVNTIIVKPNQIGSLIKTKGLIDFAKVKKITTVMSHSAGETMDNIIAHLAVGFDVSCIKLGIHGKERTAKIKELVRIEKML